MSTHNIGFYEDLTKIIFELSSNIIKCAPYFFYRGGHSFVAEGSLTSCYFSLPRNSSFILQAVLVI